MALPAGSWSPTATFNAGLDVGGIAARAIPLLPGGGPKLPTLHGAGGAGGGSKLPCGGGAGGGAELPLLPAPSLLPAGPRGCGCAMGCGAGCEAGSLTPPLTHPLTPTCTPQLIPPYVAGREALCYALRFPPNFNWGRGGTLPGVFAHGLAGGINGHTGVGAGGSGNTGGEAGGSSNTGMGAGGSGNTGGGAGGCLRLSLGWRTGGLGHASVSTAGISAASRVSTAGISSASVFAAGITAASGASLDEPIVQLSKLAPWHWVRGSM